jgi:hypothetical protein
VVRVGGAGLYMGRCQRGRWARDDGLGRVAHVVTIELSEFSGYQHFGVNRPRPPLTYTYIDVSHLSASESRAGPVTVPSTQPSHRIVTQRNTAFPPSIIPFSLTLWSAFPVSLHRGEASSNLNLVQPFSPTMAHPAFPSLPPPGASSSSSSSGVPVIRSAKSVSDIINGCNTFDLIYHTLVPAFHELAWGKGQPGQNPKENADAGQDILALWDQDLYSLSQERIRQMTAGLVFVV